MHAWKPALYRAALAPEREQELQLAARAWFGHEPSDDEHAWTDFVDFVALEWVDARGWTLAELALGRPLDDEVLRTLLGVRTGVFVVDGDDDDGLLEVRDIRTEEELYLRLDVGLPRRSVVRSRLLPAGDGTWCPSGAPDVYEPTGVVARMQLAEGWERSSMAEATRRAGALRRAFLEQRRQREAFVAWFGTDQLVVEHGGALLEALNPFLASLPAEDEAGAYTLQLELGDTLEHATGIGLVFDDEEGVQIWPGFAALGDHLNGTATAPEVLAAFLDDPAVTALPFRRLGRPELGAHKQPARVAPSLLRLS